MYIIMQEENLILCLVSFVWGNNILKLYIVEPTLISPDEGLSIVFTSIKQPAPFKRRHNYLFPDGGCLIEVELQDAVGA